MLDVILIDIISGCSSGVVISVVTKNAVIPRQDIVSGRSEIELTGKRVARIGETGWEFTKMGRGI